MDSRPSDAPSRLADIRHFIRCGNWDAADSIAGSLTQVPVPGTPAGLKNYLDDLRQTIILAKASRSVAAASLARVRAAATFQSRESPLPSERQDFVDPANPWRTAFAHPPTSSTT